MFLTHRDQSEKRFDISLISDARWQLTHKLSFFSCRIEQLGIPTVLCSHSCFFKMSTSESKVNFNYLSFWRKNASNAFWTLYTYIKFSEADCTSNVMIVIHIQCIEGVIYLQGSPTPSHKRFLYSFLILIHLKSFPGSIYVRFFEGKHEGKQHIPLQFRSCYYSQCLMIILNCSSYWKHEQI